VKPQNYETARNQHGVPEQQSAKADRTATDTQPHKVRGEETPRVATVVDDRQVTGEKTVEEGQNLEDGTCRVRQTRVKRTLPPTPLEGRGTPGGEVRITVMILTGGKARALRGQPSLRETSTWQHEDRSPD
jgi:hypothetical protein